MHLVTGTQWSDRGEPGFPEVPGNCRQSCCLATPRLEHKAEHNNCRMKGSEPDVEALSPT
jgi:hypothetical protein